MTASALALTLTACGGDDSGSGGGSGTVTPAPTPAPSPAPTPAPTPAPDPTYAVADFSAEFALSSTFGYLANYVADSTVPTDEKEYFVGGGLLDQRHFTDLIYRRNPESVDFGYDGLVRRFTAADRPSGLTYNRFDKGNERLLLTPPPYHNGFVPRYVALAMLRTAGPVTQPDGSIRPGYQYRIGLYGTPTRTSAPLPDYIGYSGTNVIWGGIAGSQAYELATFASNQQLEWSYTPSSGHLRAWVVLSSQQGVIATLSADQSTFDPETNSMSGTLIDRATGFKGTFRGQIYGPDRAELAVVFEFSHESDGSRFFGHFLGKRTQN